MFPFFKIWRRTRVHLRTGGVQLHQRSVRHAVFSFVLLCLANWPDIVSAQAVSIPDVNLRKAIKDALSVQNDADLTEAKLLELTRVFAPAISNLSGLEYARNLKELTIYRSRAIDNLEPIRELSLRSLRITVSDETYLEPISNMLSLEVLSLHDSGIDNVEILRNLLNLETLDLGDNSITDLTPFAGLIKLQILDLSDNDVADLMPLSNLANLSELWLYSNRVSDLMPLSNLAKLRSLALGFNSISSLEPLENLHSLELLKIQGNEVRDLTPIADLKLTQLLAPANKISDLSPLEDIESLKWMNLDFNDVSSLEPLRDLDLQGLSILATQVSDLMPLEDMVSLEELYIRRNSIKDLSPLCRLQAKQREVGRSVVVLDVSLPDEVCSAIVPPDPPPVTPPPPPQPPQPPPSPPSPPVTPPPPPVTPSPPVTPPPPQPPQPPQPPPSPPSPPVTPPPPPVTPPPPPPPPSAPMVMETAPTSVRMSWQAPEGSVVSSYDLRYRQDGTGDFIEGPQNVIGTRAIITRLSPDTEYEVQIRASNSTGDGDWSGLVTVQTSTPIPNDRFSLSLDMDESEGDQFMSFLSVSPDSIASIQIFGKSLKAISVNDLSVRFEYDATQVAYEGFKRGPVLSGTSALSGKDFVNIGMTLSDSETRVDSGLMGTLRFRAMDEISETEIRLVRVKLLGGGQSDTIPMFLGVALQGSSPNLPVGEASADFDGNGTVDIPDFLLFVDVFGLKKGQERYETKYDLDGNDEIGIPDFLIFVDNFGKVVIQVPVFTSAPPVTRFLEENTPPGQPIGDPISATGADGDTLMYSLWGVDAEYFAIDANTGQLETKETHNFEERNWCSPIVRVIDDNGGQVSVVVSIAIIDVAE